MGGQADDRFFGGSGLDALFGKGGDDRLFGRRDRDALDGGAGDDTLVGGAGADRMIGGKGSDLFRLRAGGLDGDVILDFNRNNGDELLLESAAPLTIDAIAPGVFAVSNGTVSETLVVKGAEVADFHFLV